ncbi:MAG: DUF488 domain-containing protein [Prevotellaceae bacterium]|jgi:hypothetical protein|nr:DUF488 domain-containing protein [Prevotellaceae bacterium]
MFYRRKILLALLQLFDDRLEKIKLQKLLFLFTQQQTKGEYDFVPYKFGCYSFSANADLTAMVQKGILSETASRFILNDKTDYLRTLKDEDKKQLQEIKTFYGKMDNKALMKYTYIHYPYWAINSTAAENILSASELEKVSKSRPVSNKTILFTIGYEGISLEEYLNRLVRNDIKLLVDVRNNPLSMKYGFSKSQLSRYCETLGIQYIHFREVGIQSEQRKQLKTQADYDNLFATYRTTILRNTQATQNTVFDLLKRHQRIALACFEANIDQCHRKHLAEAIVRLPGFCYELKHI